MLCPDFKELVRLKAIAQKFDFFSAMHRKYILPGEHMTRSIGQGMEFEEVRQYKYGDDVRSIDWNVTARTNQAHIKLYQADSCQNIIIFLDTNKYMQFGTRNTFKIVQAIKTFALLGYRCISQHNHLGFNIFGQINTNLLYSRPQKHNLGFSKMLKTLCSEEKYSNQYFSLEDTLARHLNVMPSQATCVIITDTFQCKGNIENIFANLCNRSKLILIENCDPLDINLPKVNNIMMYSDQERYLYNYTDKVSKTYNKNWEEHNTHMANLANKYGFLRVIINTTDNPVYALGMHFNNSRMR